MKVLYCGIFAVYGMLEKGVIQHSQSPWASPIVLVAKCELNLITKMDVFPRPLPRIDDSIDIFSYSQYFQHWI